MKTDNAATMWQRYGETQGCSAAGLPCIPHHFYEKAMDGCPADYAICKEKFQPWDNCPDFFNCRDVWEEEEATSTELVKEYGFQEGLAIYRKWHGRTRRKGIRKRDAACGRFETKEEVKPS